MIYIYKDTFLSGWGLAKRGSYVLSDLPLNREEFELISTAKNLNEVYFSSGKDRHFCYWCKNGYDYLLIWKGKCMPLQIGEIRQTWDMDKNVAKVIIK